MMHIQVLCNSRLYTEHQIVSTPRSKRTHMSKVSNGKDKPHIVGKLHMARTRLSIRCL